LFTNYEYCHFVQNSLYYVSNGKWTCLPRIIRYTWKEFKKCKPKLRSFSSLTTSAYKVCIGKALFMLNLVDIRWRRVVKFTPRPLYAREKSRNPFNRRLLKHFAGQQLFYKIIIGVLMKWHHTLFPIST
jgi:hypothetical protein